MATRSYIGILNQDETVTAVYCHWDGYPEGVGQTLLDYYSNPDKIRQLMELGSLSVLGEEIGEKQNFDSYEGGNETCLAYGRDREDTKGVDSKSFLNRQEFLQTCVEDYSYLFVDGEWFCRNYDSLLVPLTSVLNHASR